MDGGISQNPLAVLMSEIDKTSGGWMLYVCAGIFADAHLRWAVHGKREAAAGVRRAAGTYPFAYTTVLQDIAQYIASIIQYSTM